METEFNFELCVRAKTKTSPYIILKADPVCDGSLEPFSDRGDIWRHPHSRRNMFRDTRTIRFNRNMTCLKCQQLCDPANS